MYGIKIIFLLIDNSNLLKNRKYPIQKFEKLNVIY